MNREQLSREMQECIRNCMESHRLSLEAVNQVIDHRHGPAGEEILRLLLDCSEICQTHVNFMLRSSEVAASTAAACAEICETAADACEQFSDDLKLRACADACRRSVDSCDRMVEIEEEYLAA